MSISLKILEHGLLLYQGGGKEPVKIIDFEDFFGNLGAISLHSLDEESETLPNIFKNLADEYKKKITDFQKPMDIVSMMVTVSFLLKHSMNHFKPHKILEIGCQGGVLSYFLTKTARKIHQDSKVFCLSEILYGQEFMKVLSELGEAVANINLLTTGKEMDALRDNYFDFVVINGEEFIENPAVVIANAIRVARTGARLICLVRGQQLLHSCFAAYLDGYEEYFAAEDSSILVKIIDEKDKEILQSFAPDCLYKELHNLDADVCRILSDAAAAEAEQLENAVEKLNEMENIAIKLFSDSDDTELKYVLNSTKRFLLDYIYTTDASYREKCCQKLHDFSLNRTKYRSELLEV